MKKKFTFKNNTFLVFSIIFVYFILVINSREIREATVNAFTGFCKNILPPMFPSLVASFIITREFSSGKNNGFLNFISEALNIDTSTVGCFLISMFFGYPTGVKSVYKLYENELISRESAVSCALSSVNPGIVYSVITVGETFCNSKTIGFVLYTSVTAAQILTALVFNRMNKKADSQIIAEPQKASKRFSLTVSQAVKSTTDSVIGIGAWFTLFGITEYIVNLIPLQSFEKLFKYTLEVSSAVSNSLYASSFPKCAFSLGFGGICLYFQLAEEFSGLDISFFRYAKYRLLQGGLAALISKALFRIFNSNEAVRVTAEITENLYIHSKDTVAGLLFYCIIFMFAIANRYDLC